jgi:hypothetical protein
LTPLSPGLLAAFTLAGTELTITSPILGETIALDPTSFRGMPCIQVRTGTSGSPVNQGGTRNLQLVLVSYV